MNIELQKLYEQISKEIGIGLKHGFFDYKISCETQKGKRIVRLHSGYIYQFTIPIKATKEDFNVTLETRAQTKGQQNHTTSETDARTAQEEHERNGAKR